MVVMAERETSKKSNLRNKELVESGKTLKGKEGVALGKFW